MGQINIQQTSGFSVPPSGRLGYGFDSVGNPVMINADGSTTILASQVEGVPNITANLGVGLDVDLPTTFVQGDIYVTTDTFMVYTALDIVNWNAVDLVDAQFVTDYLVALPILYQYDGSDLVFIAGASSAPVNWLDFVPQDPVPAFTIGRIFYDEVEHTHTFYNDIEGVSLQIGEELRARLINDTGFTLLDGKAVAVIGAVGASLQVELLDTSDFNSSIRGFGLMTIETINGQPGYAIRYGAVRHLNTLTLSVGDIVYGDPDNPGEWTNVRPLSPNYPVRIGICLISDEFEGVIGVDTLAFNGSDTHVNLEGVLNGIITQTADLQISVSVGVIYADVTNENYPTKNIPFLLGGTRYYLNTTTGAGAGGAARVTVPPGASDTETQESFVYVYLNGGVPTLAIATSEPSVPYCPVADLIAFNAARTLADGEEVFGYRRSNNAIDLLDGTHNGGLGLLVDFLAAFRQKLGSNWLTGQEGTSTVNNTTIRVALSGGTGRQFRKQNLPSFDGLNYIIYNDNTNTVTYAPSTNLIDINEDASGASLAVNGAYYIIRLFYQLNSNGVVNRIIATRPLGYYSTALAAQSDGLNYAVPIGDTKIEEIIYPLYDIIIGRTGASGATVTLVELRNKKSKLATGGGGGGAQGDSIDEKFRVSATDTTTDFGTAKIIGGSGLTKTILNPAGNEQIEFKIGGNFTSDINLGSNIDAYDFRINNNDSIILLHANMSSNAYSEISCDGEGIDPVSLMLVRDSLNLTSRILINGGSGTIVLTDEIGTLGATYTGDYSAAGKADDRWLPDYGAVKSQIGGQNVDLLIITPTPTEDGYVIAWNNTNTEYELIAQTGGGNVSKVGTPLDNQVGVWTGDGTIEGTSGLTYDGLNLGITGNITISGTVDGIDIGTDVAANTAKVSNATHTGDVTGGSILTIAAGAVDLAMLSASGTPGATNFLRGDNTWAIPANTTYTFENGIYEAVGVVKLGGLMTENTNIGGASNDHEFSLTNTNSNILLTSYSSTVPSIYSRLQIGAVTTSPAYAILSVFNDGAANSLEFNSSGAILLTDVISSKGIIYGADYSSNFSARSIVDKNFIDTHIGGQAVDALITTPTLVQDGYVIAWNNTNTEYELIAGGGGTSYTFANGLTESGGAVVLGGTLTGNTNIDGNATTYSLSISNLTTFSADSNGQITLTSDNSNILLTSANGSLNLGSVSGHIFTDAGGEGGLKYAADYSSNFTSRSLVDQGFVLSEIYKTAASGLPSTTGAGDIDFARTNDYYSETAITAAVTWGLVNIAVDKVVSIDVKIGAYGITLTEAGITFKGAVIAGVVQDLDVTESNLVMLWAETATIIWVSVIKNQG